MQHTLYFFALIFSFTGLLIIDWKNKIAIWQDPKRALKTLLVAVSVFVILDCIAIALGIFVHSSSPYSLPFTVLPELPLEEVMFLLLLSYCSLLVYLEVPRWRRT